MAEIKSYPNNVDEEIGAENVMRWHHGRTSGVYGASGELAVAALSTPDMAVTVSDGNGWLSDENGNGIHFWNDNFLNTAALLQLAIDTADSVLNRIDRVIVEWSIPNYTQKPEIKILKGTAAVTPTAQALTNDASMRQISLARINVAAGTLAITAAMITDERFDASVCGVVTETVEVDTSVALAQFNEVLGDAQQLVDDLTNEAVPDHASTHASDGVDPITPESIGALPDTTTPADIGALPDTTTPGDIGAAELDSNGKVLTTQETLIYQTKTASYTLVSGDEKKITRVTTNAVNITIPANVFPEGAIIALCCTSGSLTVVAGSGVSLKLVGGYSTASPISAVALVHLTGIGTEDWLVTGCDS